MKMSMSVRSRRLLISTISVCILIAGVALFLKSARSRASASACLENLALIDGAKQEWARDLGKPPDAKPNWEDVCAYTGMPPNDTNYCPMRCRSGGTYVIGEVAHPAICSVHGFILFVVDPSARPESNGILGALVETLWSDGHEIKTHTDAIGRALVKAPENQTAAVIISKLGFVTITNPIESLYSNVSVALQRAPK